MYSHGCEYIHAEMRRLFFFFASLLALLRSLMSVSLVMLWYLVLGRLETPFGSEWERSWRNLRLPKSLEHEWSGTEGRVREPQALVVHHFGNTHASAEGFGYPANVYWAAAPVDELDELFAVWTLT